MTTDPQAAGGLPDSVHAACRRLLQLRESEEAAVVERDQALAAWWPSSGVKKTHASRYVRAALLASGWTDVQLSLAGLAGDNVRQSIERPRTLRT